MEWVETTGRTLEDAKEAALDQLGVDEEDAEFEILAEPRAGLFGRMRGEARVRARVKPARPRPKLDRRDRRRRREAKRTTSGGRADQNDAAGPSGSSAAAGADTRGVDAGSGSRRGENGGHDNASSAGGERGANGSRSRNRRRRPNRSGEPGSRQDQTSDHDHVGPDEGNGMSGDVVTIEEQVDITRSFLQGLLDSFEIEAEIKTVEVDEDTVEVQIEGDKQRLGLLIGPKGHTLQAIQELARTNLQRRAPGDHLGRVRIDIARYRQLHRDALERFTQQVAQDVIASGVRRVLEPMAPADRKVVHDVVNDLDGVRTSSEGEDPYRRVVVLPDPLTAASGAADDGVDDGAAEAVADDAVDSSDA